jgi:hypothetical protein
MAKITGRVEILVNGKLQLNKAGAVATGIMESGKSPVNRNEVMGDTGVHGFVEEVVVPQVEFTITDRDDILINDLAIITNGTVIFRAHGGGKAYTLNNAWMAEPANVTAGEGETPIVFKGISWTEQVNVI